MVLHLTDKHPQRVEPGVERTILGYGERLMMVEISIERGTAVAVHAHPHEQVSYLVRGSVRFTLDDERFVLSPGESVFIPPNAPHGAEALSDCTLVDAFSPPREDFLQA